MKKVAVSFTHVKPNLHFQIIGELKGTQSNISQVVK